jgi:hypothetical protein
MKETELWELLVSLSANDISLADTHDRIWRLFNDVRQSEQCNHNFQRVERGGEFQGNQCECGEWEDLT